ncbi:uncharacterized protein V6R79_016755 [Siganus canaliculatus]
MRKKFNKGIETGSLRVRARYSMEKIMPEEAYSKFKEASQQRTTEKNMNMMTSGKAGLEVHVDRTVFRPGDAIKGDHLRGSRRVP